LALDKALAGLAWMNVPKFARWQGVSVRTVHRDLDAFRQLGQRVVCQHPFAAGGVGHELGAHEYIWRYEPGVEPLFLRNYDRARLVELLDDLRAPDSQAPYEDALQVLDRLLQSDDADEMEAGLAELGRLLEP
jgi:hypothetical protein